MTPIYFSKIEFTEKLFNCKGVRCGRILVNIPEKEFSYQISKYKMQTPATKVLRTEKFGDITHSFYEPVPVKVIKDTHTGFKNRMLLDERFEEEVIISFSKKLNEKQMKDLLPYCNALKFEPYRNKKMSMEDDGYIGYRDEMSLSFCAMTDSYIPMLELPMNYIYDEVHIWPSEKLYRYLTKTYLPNMKQLRQYGYPYGSRSLYE